MGDEMDLTASQTRLGESVGSSAFDHGRSVWDHLGRPTMVVPDTRSKAFARQAHRDSVTVRNSPHADDDQAFVDAISAWDSE